MGGKAMGFAIVLLATALIIAGFVAYYYSGLYHDALLQYSQAQLKAERQKAQIEADYRQQLSVANSKAEEQIADVEAHYKQLVAQLSAERVPGSHPGAVRGSTAAGADAGAKRACANEPLGQDSGAAARIEAELLAVSRDCDALAVRFNTLLKLYQGFQEREKNGKH